MISVEHLSKRFGRFLAVDDLSFEVRDGEAVALWGANGAGKTTALRCVLGLLPHTGKVVVNGHRTGRSGKKARQAIGYVPQELAFHDDLRLRDTMTFFARLRGADPRRGRELLAEVGLADHTRKRIGELSGGMKQRLALALALVSDPPVLLLDEPTSNLDAAAREEFLELLVHQKRSGKTLLFSTHRSEEVAALGDRVLQLAAGRLFRTGPAESFRSRSSVTLRVVLEEGGLDEAVAALTGNGYVASRNGSAVLVEVARHQKARPIRVLEAATLHVLDFEVMETGGEETDDKEVDR